jgi:2'-5' RNA ligase
MQQDLFNEPFFEYFFLIGPDEETMKAVRELKQLLHDRIVLSWANLNSKPHLTLLEFRTTESAEEEIIRKSIAALSEHSAFPVALDGAMVFEHGRSSRSLVLKVADPKPVLETQALLKKALRLKRQRMTPHLTIARDIPLANFNKLESLDDFNYTGEFRCDRILLLKKPAAVKAAYTVLHEVLLK